MWKKSESNGTPTRDEPSVQPPSPSRPPVSAAAAPRESATIGTSISVAGDITGKEDLLVLGAVEGKIELRDNNVTIGSTGCLKADISAKTIVVEGEVEGTLNGGERVVLKKAARVRGDITAPRIVLEDGAQFRGSIDMDVASSAKPSAASAVRTNRPAGADKTSQAVAPVASVAAKGEG